MCPPQRLGLHADGHGDSVTSRMSREGDHARTSSGTLDVRPIQAAERLETSLAFTEGNSPLRPSIPPYSSPLPSAERVSFRTPSTRPQTIRAQTSTRLPQSHPVHPVLPCLHFVRPRTEPPSLGCLPRIRPIPADRWDRVCAPGGPPDPANTICTVRWVPGSQGASHGPRTLQNPDPTPDDPLGLSADESGTWDGHIGYPTGSAMVRCVQELQQLRSRI
ncbi:hypothetical protein BC628DRAFT_916014 [Trametes gibbosa]|nr:hypothetical protein BC628DRAFT_916014 [Trametes gibbosa]